MLHASEQEDGLLGRAFMTNFSWLCKLSKRSIFKEICLLHSEYGVPFNFCLGMLLLRQRVFKRYWERISSIVLENAKFTCFFQSVDAAPCIELSVDILQMRLGGHLSDKEFCRNFLVAQAFRQ